MKALLALALLVCSYAHGQTDDSTKYINYRNQYGMRMPRGWFDSVLHIPYGDTARFRSTKNGAIMMHTTGDVVKWYNDKWNLLGGGSSGLAKNGISAIGDTTVFGQDSAQSGNPAALLSTREIPLNGKRLYWSGEGDWIIGSGNTGLFGRTGASIARFAINDTTSRRQLVTIGNDIFNGQAITSPDRRSLMTIHYKDSLTTSGLINRLSRALDVRNYHFVPESTLSTYNDDPAGATNFAGLFEQRFYIKDTLKTYNPGADLIGGLHARQYFMQFPGFTGKSNYVPKNAFAGYPNDAYAAMVVTNQINNNGGSNAVRVHGTLSNFLSTIIATNGRDTIDDYSPFLSSTAFLSPSVKIKKAHGFRAFMGGFLGGITDTIWGVYQDRFVSGPVPIRNYFGNTTIVADTIVTPNIIQKDIDTSSYKVKVVDASGNEFKMYWPSSSASAALASTYIGVGDGSNLLSGSAALTYTGTEVQQINSGAISKVINNAALSATSGGAQALYTYNTPTASTDQIGIINFGSAGAGSNNYIGASIGGFANGAWTGGSSHFSRLVFSTTNSGSATPSEVMRISNGRVSIGTSTAGTAYLTLRGGGSGSNAAPVKYNPGTLQITPEAGANEYDGTNWYQTNSSGNRAVSEKTRVQVTSSGTVAMDAGISHYVFNGTTSTFTLPAVTASVNVVFVIKNRGSGNITVNSNAGANDIYDTSAGNTYTVTPGAWVEFIGDGTFFSVKN